MVFCVASVLFLIALIVMGDDQDGDGIT